MEAVVTQEQYAQKWRESVVFHEKELEPKSFKIIEVNGEKIPVLSDFPVENVTWHQAKAYADALSKVDPEYKLSFAHRSSA